MERNEEATPSAVNAASVADAASDGHGSTKPKYLKERNGTYYFMRRIPAKVVQALSLKSDQMWRSLWTTNRDEAIKRLPDGLRDFNSWRVYSPPLGAFPYQANVSEPYIAGIGYAAPWGGDFDWVV